MFSIINQTTFINLIRILLSFTIIIFISSFLISGTLHAEPSCKSIKKERQLFLKNYKKKQYLEAYSKLSDFMKQYSNSEKCRNKNIKDQIWAYSDLALAAYKIKDPGKCFEFTYYINDLIENREDEFQKPAKALIYNYKKCMGLKDGYRESSKVSCRALPGNFCGNFKFSLVDKIGKDKSYKNKRCKHKNHVNGLDLSAVGESGCLILKSFERVEGDEARICPQLIWVNGSNKNRIYVEPSKNSHGYIQNMILDDSNCCNIEPGILSIKKSGSKILLKMSGMGRDCYGGSASWFFHEIYILDLEDKKITLTENISVGLQ